MINKLFTVLCVAATLGFTSCSSDDDSPSGPISIVIEGASVSPEVGGPNQQNQVYVDLSTNTSTSVQRDSWDLGFYSGDEFKVTINGSIYMATAPLTTTDIDAVSSSNQEVQELQPQVAVGTFQAASAAFVDAPSGDISETAIATISENDADNKVYLLNLGYEVGTETPETGTIAVTGESRGWMKIRVLKDGNDYVLQYANLDDATHEEVVVSKSNEHNFTFFSFNTNSEVNVEPASVNWDLNFTVFTNLIEGYGAYGYSDFVVNNTKANVGIYMIDSEVETELTYNEFTLANVVDANFVYNDQRTIGSSWRNGGGPSASPSVKENVFYIISDTDGNLYKLKFLAMSTESGERGNPEFVYSLLQ
ncbi:HmuY family protein [Mangrovimonas sp. DI 80]|uniref:HmuY family protein n=1 Tax=Mangrovimonas sp. DI 80 TaxID=1779330 RepID=UPI0009760A71|nr:HmuY family protein [Mangrovimonas sp. DI 80]OMP32058.1 hypothetical protein BKM32_03105 [Mangrovimonas sp. DI 80]